MRVRNSEFHGVPWAPNCESQAMFICICTSNLQFIYTIYKTVDNK